MPAENRIVVDEEPCLVPLPEALHHQREYLAVLTDPERGELHAADVAGTHLLQEMAQEHPAPHRTVGRGYVSRGRTSSGSRRPRPFFSDATQDEEFQVAYIGLLYLTLGFICLRPQAPTSGQDARGSKSTPLSSGDLYREFKDERLD
jgi:hypothetical protein